MRVSKTNHSLSAGIYAADFAACPKILPRPRKPRSNPFAITTKITARTWQKLLLPIIDHCGPATAGFVPESSLPVGKAGALRSRGINASSLGLKPPVALTNIGGFFDTPMLAESRMGSSRH